jgi:hypothetical protein
VFYFITTILLINLFILILINQYEEYHLNPDNPLHSFEENLERFRKAWSKFTSEHKGTKLEKAKLIKFLISLKPPMGKLK